MSPSFHIGGTISGLTAGGLVLANHGGADLTVAANATRFEFATELDGGSPYDVTVLTQPTPGPARRWRIATAADVAALEVDDYVAAVTMISTSRPGNTSCGDTTHARTGALSGSTHSFHASLWAAKCFMSVSHTWAVSSFAFEVPAVASSWSIRPQIRRV